MRAFLVVASSLLALVASAAPVPDRLKPGTAKKDGLALTVTLNKQAFAPDDEIVLSFQLKNETDKVLFVADGYLGPKYHEAGPGRHFEVHVTANETAPLYFWSGMATEGRTGGIRRVFKLKPGESYTGTIRLSAGAANDRDFASRPHEERGGSFENIATRQRHVLGKDARKYTVSLRYHVDPESQSAWEPPEDFKQELLWRGELRSSPVSFEIAEK
jgi:hypothetical protein